MAGRQTPWQHASAWDGFDVAQPASNNVNHHPVSHFNPTTPSFQPAQLAMQWPNPLPPIPPATDYHKNAHNLTGSLNLIRPVTGNNQAPGLTEVKKALIDYHIDHQRDIRRFESKVQAQEDQIALIKESAGNDLNTLHWEIMDLRSTVVNMGQEQQADREFVQTADKEKMLAEVEGHEYYAKRLRERMEESCPGMSTLPHMVARLNAIEGLPTKVNDSEVKTIEATKYGASNQANRNATPEPQAQSERVDTPTHVPARRAAIEKKISQAVEIKPPREDEVADDQKVSNVIDPASTPPTTATAAIEEGWVPQAVANMPSHTPSAMPEHTTTFTWEHIFKTLGGKQYSPGLYLASPPWKSHPSPLQGRTYWLLEAQFEPYIPTAPGHHGAKLTAFFNDTPTPEGFTLGEEDFMEVPVFVSLDGAKEYTYMGHYSQKRYSDKLSHSEMLQRVPHHVRKYWAQQLADKERPAWITEKLTDHFWPRPTYNGRIPTDSAIASPATAATITEGGGDMESPLERTVRKNLENYAKDLKNWAKDVNFKASMLTEEVLMESWDKSDLDENKGLRLWWEYLECVSYEDRFYERLVALKAVKKVEQQPAVAPAAEATKVQSAVEPQPKVPEKAITLAPHERARLARSTSSNPSSPAYTTTTSKAPAQPAAAPNVLPEQILPPHKRVQQVAAPAKAPIIQKPAAAPANAFVDAGIGDMEAAKAFARDTSRGRSNMPAGGGRGPGGRRR